MAKMIHWHGDVSVGAMHFPDRKRPSLCIQRGNECVVYGTFQSEDSAEGFMTELAKLVGAIGQED